MRGGTGMKSHERLACSQCSRFTVPSTHQSFRCKAQPRLRSCSSRVAAQCVTLHAPLFQQRHISGKGLGLVAATDVPAGTAVLEEQVLLSVTAAPSEEWEVLSAAIKALPEADRAAYFQLANSFAAQHSDAYGVYRTNGFRTSRGGSARPRHGVFGQLSRVNHSCLANCAVSTHSGKLAVRHWDVLNVVLRKCECSRSPESCLASYDVSTHGGETAVSP